MTEHTLELKMKFKAETGEYVDIDQSNYIDWLERKVVKLFAMPGVSNSTCDKIFNEASKIDIDNDIDYGQFPL